MGGRATKWEGGGYKMGGGGHVKLYPYEKGGVKNSSHAKGGAQSFGVLFMW